MPGMDCSLVSGIDWRLARCDRLVADDWDTQCPTILSDNTVSKCVTVAVDDYTQSRWTGLGCQDSVNLLRLANEMWHVVVLLGIVVKRTRIH